MGTRRRFNVEAWLKFRREVVSTLIQRWISDVEKMLVFQRCFNVEYWSVFNVAVQSIFIQWINVERRLELQLNIIWLERFVRHMRPGKDSDRPAHPCSLTIYSSQYCVYSLDSLCPTSPECEQWITWSYCWALAAHGWMDGCLNYL